MKRLATRSRVSQIVAGASVVAFAISAQRVYTQTTDRASVQHRSQQDRFQPIGAIDPELAPTRLTAAAAAVTEAPSGFDNLTNGFDPQGPPFDDLDEDTVMPGRSFNDNRFIFEEVEGADEGLGPTFNAQSCRECHQNVVTGGASQITEQRTGRLVGGIFFESLGGSLIHSRATRTRDRRARRRRRRRPHLPHVDQHPRQRFRGVHLQHHAARDPPRRAARQLARHRGRRLRARGRQRDARRPVRPGRASTPACCRFRPTPTSTRWALPARCSRTRTARVDAASSTSDPMDDPEDDGDDVEAFANFMRSTKAPPRGPITGHKVAAGRALIDQIGCVKAPRRLDRDRSPGMVYQRR